jgi:hypothetical protein
MAVILVAIAAIVVVAIVVVVVIDFNTRYNSIPSE